MNDARRRPMNLLVTAGPTHEAIDPVRYIANRSSGKMGFALAGRAAARGWHVTLIAGPVHLDTPAGVHRVDVISAAAMFAAVATHLPDTTAAILAAAVADFRPIAPAAHKIKKVPETERLVLELEKTTDILGSLRQPLGFTGILTGFAAETENLLANAAGKLRRKGCDLLVANDVSRSDIGFGADANQVTLLFADGRPAESLPRLPKNAVADIILDHIAALAGRDS